MILSMIVLSILQKVISLFGLIKLVMVLEILVQEKFLK
ncbi:unnamed protein product [Trichobilharzia regenti]|nr:unnamed protein product [Trichobilharzia regenti]